MKIDLVTLRSFVAILEEGTIARAATRVHLAPSVVSKRIAELEDHLRTSNSASMWKMMRLVGDESAVQGGGRLFREH